MSDLKTLQKRMAHAILDRDMEALAGEFAAGKANPEHRLNIYTNNTYVSLKACLRATFPVTLLLADQRFFDYASDIFIGLHPPREARLSRYGAAFPKFLATFTPCRDYPIVTQMAAMEWAIADMMQAPEVPSVPMLAVSAIACSKDDAWLGLQPNIRFVISGWPLVQTWHEHQNGAPAVMSPLVPEVTRTAITRKSDDLHFLTLDPARFTFWRSLARGFPIRVATSRALARDRLFDLVNETALLFRLNLVTSVSSSSSKGATQ